ncbi:hypothetical protein BDR26DRAFT_852336 [Obelidium mucronatum]|nr:hypothetical protein BDR26DRAFT_852336 [Obelidium mucronatum]
MATNHLRINNLIRPFNERIARKVLESNDRKIEFFWVNKIKTFCLVSFENNIQASDAMNVIDGQVFPPDTGSTVQCQLISKHELDSLMAEEVNNTSGSLQSSNVSLNNSSSSLASGVNRPDSSATTTASDKLMDSKGRQLFKTKAEPVILYSYALQ